MKQMYASLGIGPEVYGYGIGTASDPARAAEYYRKAADLGDAEAWDGLDRLGQED